MKYRPEIDGLRAVAVVPVILFHAGIENFSGGFVGVDIFFAISGFLITSVIINDMAAGRFSLLNFYERRARRILPALFLVMLACIPFAWMWMAPTETEKFAKSFVAVATFWSNHHFWSEINYFDTAAELKPLIHTWSLAIEEQFYILFPAFMLLTWRYGLTRISLLLGIACFISLGAALWFSGISPVATFYWLPTRAWEILMGALVALYLHRHGTPDLGPATKTALSVIGLVAIMVSVFVYDRNMPWLSFYTLLPTVGALLIIIYGQGSKLIVSLLGSRPLVGIGLISYGLYLWHHPIFAFARMRYFGEMIEIPYGFLIVLSFALAFLSWRFVEMPFRQKQTISPKLILRTSVIGTLIAVGFGIVGQSGDGLAWRYNFAPNITASFKPFDEAASCLDREGVESGEDWLCLIGDKTRKPSFLVFGDSHATVMYDAFDIAANNVGKSGYFVSVGACLPFYGVTLPGSRRDIDCSVVNDRVASFAMESSAIASVYLIARWNLYLDGGIKKIPYFLVAENVSGTASLEESPDAFRGGLISTIDLYKRANKRLVVMAEVPEQPISIEWAYVKAARSGTENNVFESTLRDLSVKFAVHRQRQNHAMQLFQELAQDGELAILNVDDLICDENVCLIGNSEHTFYFDDNHLSMVGARRLTNRIESYLNFGND